MTKGELRKARKAAHEQGQSLTGELALSRSKEQGHGQEFSETAKGYRARDRWAKRYYELNGAPEGDYDC